MQREDLAERAEWLKNLAENQQADLLAGLDSAVGRLNVERRITTPLDYIEALDNDDLWAGEVPALSRWLLNAASLTKSEDNQSFLGKIARNTTEKAQMRKRRFVWSSTVSSTDEGVVSILAAIELLAMVALSLWIVAYYETWTHVMIGAAFAPLLLLRTDDSTRYGLVWFIRWVDETDDYLLEKWGDNSIFGNVAIVLIAAPVARIGATVLAAVKNPRRSLASIPTNWWRAAMCTDLMHPPELVPGIENYNKTPTWMRNGFIFSESKAAVFNDLKKRKDVGGNIFAMFLIGPLFLLAWALRWTLKATAIIWLPLLWIIPKATGNLPIRARLAFINRTSWGRFVTLLSFGSLGLFILKIAYYTGIQEINEWWDKCSISTVLNPLVQPTIIPLWQMIGAINAALAISLYFFSSERLVALEYGAVPDEGMKWTELILRTGAFLRAIFSLYTISCLAYIVLNLTHWVAWPPLGDRMFPWSDTFTP